MVYGNGHYVRRAGDVWRYAMNGEPVPEAKSRRLRGRIILEAPELHPDALLSIEQAAARVGVRPHSWRVMVSRRLAPSPVFRFGGSPVWTRGVLDAWLRLRPGKGGRPAVARP